MDIKNLSSKKYYSIEERKINFIMKKIMNKILEEFKMNRKLIIEKKEKINLLSTIGTPKTWYFEVYYLNDELGKRITIYAFKARQIYYSKSADYYYSISIDK